MFCPACGVRNPGEARFCNQCGASVAAPTPSADAVAKPPLQHSAPARDPAPLASRLPTMGGDAHAVSLPMSGPSTRTLTTAGVAIAVCGLAIGATIAWRAARHTDSPAPLIVPESRIALVETPRVIGADAGPSEPQPSAVRTIRAVRSAGSPTTPHEPPHVTRAPARTATQPSAPVPALPTATPPPETGGEIPGASDPPEADPANATAPAASAGERTDATGTMDSATIQGVYRDHRTQLAACQMLMGGDNATVGTMVLRVRVGTDGHVLRTRMASNSTHNAMLGTCVQNAIREWVFPPPQGGEVEFEYSLGFGS